MRLRALIAEVELTKTCLMYKMRDIRRRVVQLSVIFENLGKRKMIASASGRYKWSLLLDGVKVMAESIWSISTKTS